MYVVDNIDNQEKCKEIVLDICKDFPIKGN